MPHFVLTDARIRSRIASKVISIESFNWIRKRSPQSKKWPMRSVLAVALLNLFAFRFPTNKCCGRGRFTPFDCMVVISTGIFILIPNFLFSFNLNPFFEESHLLFFKFIQLTPSIVQSLFFSQNQLLNIYNLFPQLWNHRHLVILLSMSFKVNPPKRKVILIVHTNILSDYNSKHEYEFTTYEISQIRMAFFHNFTVA